MLKKLFTIITIIAIITFAGYLTANETKEGTHPYTSWNVISNMFDTSTIEENWGGYDNSEGTIRMIGAQLWDSNVIDEDGNIWEVNTTGLEDNVFLLLWIADSNTPDDISDDIVIKTWVEVYE